MRHTFQIDRVVLARVLAEARERVKARGQWAWGNALEKAGEELRDEPTVEVEIEPEAELALIYPPHERIGVTYCATSRTCQCEAHADGLPCRHRAKARLVALCAIPIDENAPS